MKPEWHAARLVRIALGTVIITIAISPFLASSFAGWMLRFLRAVKSIETWAWPGWQGVSALGTFIAAVVALIVYLSEVSRRRRAERTAVRVWAEGHGDETTIHILNGSTLPIFDIRIFAACYTFGPDSRSQAGWIAQGPNVMHPAASARCAVEHVRWTVRDMPAPTPRPHYVRMTYTTRGVVKGASHSMARRLPRSRAVIGIAAFQVS